MHTNTVPQACKTRLLYPEDVLDLGPCRPDELHRDASARLSSSGANWEGTFFVLFLSFAPITPKGMARVPFLQLPRPGQLSTEASGGILRGRRRDERVTITLSRIFAHMYPQNR